MNTDAFHCNRSLRPKYNKVLSIPAASMPTPTTNPTESALNQQRSEDVQLEELIRQTQPGFLRPLCFFVSWQGVMTLAYRFFDPGTQQSRDNPFQGLPVACSAADQRKSLPTYGRAYVALHTMDPSNKGLYVHEAQHPSTTDDEDLPFPHSPLSHPELLVDNHSQYEPASQYFRHPCAFSNPLNLPPMNLHRQLVSDAMQWLPRHPVGLESPNCRALSIPAQGEPGLPVAQDDPRSLERQAAPHPPAAAGPCSHVQVEPLSLGAFEKGLAVSAPQSTHPCQSALPPPIEGSSLTRELYNRKTGLSVTKGRCQNAELHERKHVPRQDGLACNN